MVKRLLVASNSHWTHLTKELFVEFKPIRRKQKIPDFLKDSDNPKDSRQSESLNLYDDPEWKTLREDIKKRAREDVDKNKKPIFFNRRPIKPDYKSKTESGDPERVEVSIKLSVPKVDWSRLQNIKKKLLNLKGSLSRDLLKKRPKRYKILIGVAIVIGLGTFIALVNNGNHDNSSNKPATSQQISSEPLSHDPPFSPILPSKGIEKEKIAYNSQRNFAKYDDNIKGTTISVSQQPLPDNLKSDSGDGLEKVAQGLEAKELVQIGGGGVAYIKQTVQGPQTIVFKKFNLLVFIKTGNQVDTDEIVNYIDGLN